jgi:hypothetical protein
MDLKKLPPSMLVLLGLGCPGVQACLSPPVDSAEASSSEPITVSACLSPPLDSTTSTSSSGSGSGSGESEVGPCLSPPGDTFGTETGSDSGTGTGTSSGSDSGSGSGSEGGTTVGACLAPPGIQPDDTPESLASATRSPAAAMSRREALERVLAALPSDVAARLRQRSDLD